ncbi:MAG: FmdE, Molybdenum formylmethanofuran dehydrogenase operon [bacterium ADurb.Bin243]|nr:MAG: FmdE, Molybdenum formylmethanofuran dehydrogenase operon [bacterium ADurb.Bin243]HOD42866.1 FmdE family protein [Candidatus Wallbacteria bacterium]
MLYEKLKPLIEKTLGFHVKNAPGVIMGVYMVDYAYELLDSLYPDRDSYVLNAICETRVCLIDAIQVLTGCTVGNKYLRLDALDIGRYALTLYNRDTALGFRVYMDLGKIDKNVYPELFAFFNKSRDYKSASRSTLSEKTIDEFYKAERSVLSFQKVKVNLPAKDDLAPAAVCAICRESFLIACSDDLQNPVCGYCSKLAQNKAVPFQITE